MWSNPEAPFLGKAGIRGSILYGSLGCLGLHHSAQPFIARFLRPWPGSSGPSAPSAQGLHIYFLKCISMLKTVHLSTRCPAAHGHTAVMQCLFIWCGSKTRFLTGPSLPVSVHYLPHTQLLMPKPLRFFLVPPACSVTLPSQRALTTPPGRSSGLSLCIVTSLKQAVPWGVDY